MHWTYIVLLAVCAFAYWQRVPAISRVATVFLANSAIMTLWALTVDPVIDPVVQMVVDLVSAGIIMKDPAGREQGWIGLILGARFGASLAFLFYGIPEATANYWHFMNMAAQVMMFVLLVWSEDNGGQIGRAFHRLCRFVVGYHTRHNVD